MRTRILILFAVATGLSLLPVSDALARGFGGGFAGGFHAGGFGGGGFGGFRAGGFHGGDFGGFGGFHASSFHAGGFSGGYGSVQHFGASHYGPATGFTHVGGTSAEGWGGSAYHTSYASHGYGYGSVTHYDSAGVYGHTYSYGGYGAAAYHGPYGGTAAVYHGPYTSGAAVRGPYGYGAAAVKGPYGGTAAVYHGPYSSGVVAHLPSGYTATAWHGSTYYHYGGTYYQPIYYGGACYYWPVMPPMGFFVVALPPATTTVVVSGTTYYVANGVYYQPSAQNGKAGYVVVQSPVPASQPVALAPAGGIGPDPFASLQKMSDYMGKQKHFMMQTSETFDQVATAGEKIQFSAVQTLRVARPDKLSVDAVTGAGKRRHLVFDGKQITLVDLSDNLYAILPLEGTLDVALDKMDTQYAMAKPVDDLLYSDIYGRLAGKLQTGQYLGQDFSAGLLCDHFAYTQQGLSWQIWMEPGDKPAPRKLVISYDSAPGRPQFTVLVTNWDTRAEWPREFKVKIPPTAMPASVMTLTGQVTTAGQ
jgi:hypothetical protein